MNEFIVISTIKVLTGISLFVDTERDFGLLLGKTHRHEMNNAGFPTSDVTQSNPISYVTDDLEREGLGIIFRYYNGLCSLLPKTNNLEGR